MEERVAEPGGPAAQIKMTAAVHLHGSRQCRAGNWPGLGEASWPLIHLGLLQTQD